jgi:dihydroorotase
MPVAKRPEDRSALVAIVKEGHPSFFSGTDSAPHKIEDKETACGCAGIFNSPYHMQFLASFFEEQGMQDRLVDFCTRFGNDFYRMPPSKQEIALKPEPFQVPDQYGPMVPFKAGKTLAYSLHLI